MSVAWLHSMFAHTRARTCGAVWFLLVRRVFNLAPSVDCFGACCVADSVRRFCVTKYFF